MLSVAFGFSLSHRHIHTHFNHPPTLSRHLFLCSFLQLPKRPHYSSYSFTHPGLRALWMIVKRHFFHPEFEGLYGKKVCGWVGGWVGG